MLDMETHASNWKAIVYLQCHTLLLAYLLSSNTLPLGVCELRGGEKSNKESKRRWVQRRVGAIFLVPIRFQNVAACAENESAIQSIKSQSSKLERRES